MSGGPPSKASSGLSLGAVEQLDRDSSVPRPEVPSQKSRFFAVKAALAAELRPRAIGPICRQPPGFGHRNDAERRDPGQWSARHPRCRWPAPGYRRVLRVAHADVERPACSGRRKRRRGRCRPSRRRAARRGRASPPSSSISVSSVPPSTTTQRSAETRGPRLESSTRAQVRRVVKDASCRQPPVVGFT